MLDQEPVPGDLTGEEFRFQLHRVADWIADYRAGIESLPISSPVTPGQIAAEFPAELPDGPEPVERLLEEFERVILPGVVHWGHPAFLGYFGSTTTAAGVLAEALAAALNVSAMTWRVSPAATELESVVLRWLRQMLGLPPELEGVVYDSASIATLHALAAARESAGLCVRRAGLGGRAEVPQLTIYASDQAHSSVEKAAITLGLGEDNVRRVATDSQYRMDVSALRGAVAEDVRAGRRPLAVVATVGTTSTAAVDPVPEIAELSAEHGLWLHVDAAYGGAMALLPEGRWAMAGTERADSVVMNPHKWLFVPFDFSALYVRRPELLRAVFSLVPEYLRGDAGDGTLDYMDYGIQLGRRFRALKAWMVFRAFGRQGLAARIREHRRLALLMAAWIDSDPDFELLAPVEMAVVCFRARSRSYLAGNGDPAPDERPDERLDERLNDLNRAVAQAVNASGRAYLTTTELRGRVALRVALGNVLTTERHLRETWNLIREEAARCVSEAAAPRRGRARRGVSGALHADQAVHAPA